MDDPEEAKRRRGGCDAESRCEDWGGDMPFVRFKGTEKERRRRLIRRRRRRRRRNWKRKGEGRVLVYRWRQGVWEGEGGNNAYKNKDNFLGKTVNYNFDSVKDKRVKEKGGTIKRRIFQ
jgi:hypothetical protein